MPQQRNSLQLEAAGALTVGVKDRYQAPHSGEIVDVRGVVGTAPTGADLIFEIRKNGTTMYTTAANRPRVVAGATESADATVAKPDVVSFARGDTLDLNITQVGSTVAGSDLDVTVEFVAV